VETAFGLLNLNLKLGQAMHSTLSIASAGSRIQPILGPNMAREPVLSSGNVDRLATLVEESVRASRDGVRYFLEPTSGVLAKAKNKRHHIIFGRRGSGKSSLLQKVASDLTINRTPIAFVDLEAFKGHSYPDVLVSVLIKSISEVKDWLDSAATNPASKTSFWKRLFGSAPTKPAFNKAKTGDLSKVFGAIIRELDSILHGADETHVRDLARKELGAEAKAGVSAVSASANLHFAAERQSEYSSRKIEALHRNIMKYQDAFRKLTELADGPAFLLLDDLYHIRLSDQAAVIDYFHRIAKGANVWLKIGTIRHRSSWYTFGDPPIGMKLGDDADEIDLDVTLEKYEPTRMFLLKILGQFAKTAEVNLNDIVADGARDRLVLASGGVARDFLTIFGQSLVVARERVMLRNLARGEKIGVEDVNVAAGQQGQFKEEDFTRDSGEDRDRLLSEFQKIYDFCISANANCFLVEKDITGIQTQSIDELVDLKLLHRARSRVTVRDRKGRLYDAYMLDLSRYTGERARRNFELVQFWGKNSEDTLRRASLIFLERSPAPTAQ
jgi:hypothetical protein